MEAHSPPDHRAHVAALRAAGDVRAACADLRLAEPYNDALAALEAFRAQHKAFAAAYIARFARGAGAEKGTGGSDFVPALQAYKDATQRARLL